MFIHDLSTNGYFTKGDDIRSVGWLEAGHFYTRGLVPPGLLSLLKTHVDTAHQVIHYLGIHRCSLCVSPAWCSGKRNVLIPTPTVLYIAPELITHYIVMHDYRPPSEFLSAVAQCPPQESEAYFALLARFVPRWEAKVAGLTDRA